MTQSDVFDSGIPLFKDVYVLLIGTSVFKYRETADKFPKICWADKDAINLYTTLRAIGYSISNIEKICNEKSTKDNIEKNLSVLRDKLCKNRGKLVWIYWASHGCYHDKDNYLMTYDTELNNLQKTAFNIRRLVHTVAQFNAEHVAVFMDACCSNPPTRESSEVGPVRAVVGHSGSAYEISGQGGVFASSLCEGLQGSGGIADHTGVVDLFSLVPFLRRDVLWRFNSWQVPVFDLFVRDHVSEDSVPPKSYLIPIGRNISIHRDQLLKRLGLSKSVSDLTSILPDKF